MEIFIIICELLVPGIYKRRFTKREAILKQQRELTTKKNPKIKRAKKRSKVHEKVTLNSKFHFGSFFWSIKVTKVKFI